MGESRIAGIGAGVLSTTSGIDVVKRQEEAAEVMFADIFSMNGSTDVNNFAADVSDEMLSTIESNKMGARNERPADAFEKYQYKDKTITAKSDDRKTENTEQVTAKVKEFEEEVTEVVAEELHISKEELEAAMEELGLTYLDLLDKGNLANLVAKLTGSENLGQLLCNEAFTNVLVKVDVLGKEFLADVQLTPEELQELKVHLLGMTGADSKVNSAGTEDEIPELQAADNTVETDEISNQNDLEDATEIEIIRLDSVEEDADVFEENLSEGEQKFAGGQSNKMVQGQNAQIIEQNVAAPSQNVTTFAEQLGEVETVQTLPPHMTAADIMEQFAEHTRVLFSADTTKIEMQLNPEHLGKLYVEVIENEGSVTAKIQTQNTVVKEALEMQIADLKVNLSQAGVKVDSVEVTVASHEFERNLEQDANSKKQQEDTQTKSAKHRNINLNSLDDLSGLMTEEETLVAKMMAEQGNQINFSA